MQIQDEALYTRLLEHLKARKFTIIRPNEKDAPIPRTLLWISVLFGSSSDFTDEQLRSSLISLYEVSDLVGVSLQWGAPRIALAIEADEIGDESLVGRFRLLHDKIGEFRKYSCKFFNSRFNTGQGAIAVVLLIFRQPYKADYFLNNLSAKCKQSAYWKCVCTLPLIIDVPGKKVIKWKGWPQSEQIGEAQLASHLFG